MAEILECAKLVSGKKNEMGVMGLHKRQDDDMKLFRLEKFALTNYKGKKLEKVDNFTGNDPELFASRGLSIMNTANMRIIVEGLEAEQANKIEQFHWWALDQADRRLLRKKMGLLRDNLNFGAGMRGWTGSRVLVYRDEKTRKIVFDILPIDMRYCDYDMGAEDIAWAAPRRSRTKSQVASQYKFEPHSKSVVVVDFWDEIKNTIYIEGTNHVLNQWEHKRGFNPVIIEPVMMTPPVGDVNDMKYWGESFFAGTRNLYDEKNKLATIMQTVNMMGWKRPMGYSTKEGGKLPEDSPYTPGVVIAMQEGDKWIEVPLADIRELAPFMYREISAAIQRRTFSYIEYGELGFELAAVAIVKLAQGKLLVLAPFVSAVKLHYKQICESIKKQFIDQDLEVELGAPGKKVKYTPKDLEGDYEINFDFVTISPEENIANYSVAAAARPFLPDDMIRELIIKLEDPKGAGDKLADQLAEIMSPAVRLYRIYKVLYNAEKFDEAELVWMDLENLYAQAAAPPGGEPDGDGGKPGALASSLPRLFGGATLQEGQKRTGMEVSKRGG